MARPTIQTTVVGSYPIPSWLALRPTGPTLRDARLVVLRTQELAGIDVVGEGELGRFDPDHPETNGMIEHFTRPLDGVAPPTRADRVAFEADASMRFRTRPAGVVCGPLDSGRLDLLQEWRDIRELTDHPLKFTVTSPYMLGRTLLDRHHGDRRIVCAELARILADQVSDLDSAVLQVDEATITGHPEDLTWAHEPINTVLDAARGERAVHLCFGNYGGRTIQRGDWKTLLPLLDRLHADHLLLELARRPEEELEVLRDLRTGVVLGVGVIDVKDNEPESPDLVARRIERAVRVLGEERVRWVHPDCGLWMLHRSVADAKLRALVAGRDLYLAP